ncbi:MAG TPA: hypothetical protein VMU75_11880 [Acidimicrobiales bacterium]|nr:hypothetical protein [Acidimicrobiales bacterium]
MQLLLVPSVMYLLGRSCWWLPRWLDRVLPRIDAEGGEDGDADEGARRHGERPSPAACPP